ncbi:MAG: MFS transporter [Candidatus Hodarchaeota archaeon]
MKQWVYKRLDIAEMPPQSQSLAIRYFCLFSVQVAKIQIVTTFLVLFLLEIVTFAELGLLLAVQFAIIFLTDYPTGALGDTIGQQKVLMLAYLTQAMAILFLLGATSFTGYLPWTILAALGASQESGALESWFDNNYRVTIGDLDSDRKVYGAFQAKILAQWRILSGTLFILGGVIAGVFSRRLLFTIQLGMVVIALLLILRLMTADEKPSNPQSDAQTYQDKLIGSLQFVISSKGLFFLFLGLAIFWGTVAVWASLLLFPYYEGYAGTDENTGLLRAIVFYTGILWTLYMAKIAKRITSLHRPLFLAYLMAPLLLGLLFVYYEVFPPTNQFVLATFLGLILLWQWANIMVPLRSILQSRLLLDITPDEYRNGIYSLMPSLNVAFSVPLLILEGFVIRYYGFAAGILFVAGLLGIGTILLGIGLYWLAKHVEPTPQSAPTS